jgi:hypothetical protein
MKGSMRIFVLPVSTRKHACPYHVALSGMISSPFSSFREPKGAWIREIIGVFRRQVKEENSWGCIKKRNVDILFVTVYIFCFRYLWKSFQENRT